MGPLLCVVRPPAKPPATRLVYVFVLQVITLPGGGYVRLGELQRRAEGAVRHTAQRWCHRSTRKVLSGGCDEDVKEDASEIDVTWPIPGDGFLG